MTIIPELRKPVQEWQKTFQKGFSFSVQDHCIVVIRRKALPIKASLWDCKGNSHDTFPAVLKLIFNTES